MIKKTHYTSCLMELIKNKKKKKKKLALNNTL